MRNSGTTRALMYCKAALGGTLQLNINCFLSIEFNSYIIHSPMCNANFTSSVKINNTSFFL